MIEGTNPRIAIIGAGPSGILTAHYLREQGYDNVMVLEKLGRVGGRACSITLKGYSFDLGANYVTPAYTEIRKIAKKLGMEMYSERPFVSMNIPKDPTAPVGYESMFKSSRFDDKTGKEIGVLAFMGAVARYIWKRWQLRKIIDKPTFAGVESYDEGSLTLTMEEWLEKYNLTALRRVLQLPSTLMGYGYLYEIAAIYPLKFMTLKTFIPMAIKEMPLVGGLYPWPKRFTYGYQRFFQRLAWDLDVRLNVDISKIHRSDSGVSIHYEVLEQDLDDTAQPKGVLDVDYVFLACPLNVSVSGELLELTDEEKQHFLPVKFNSYCMSTFSASMPDNTGLGGQSPLAAVYPVPPLDDDYTPYGVARQWDNCDFVQVYTRTKNNHQDHPVTGEAPEVEKAVMAAAERVLKQMGATIEPSTEAMRSFNRWAYFQHVEPSVIRDQAWYSKLETLQGKNRTFYVGGVTNFDLIEPIAEYAKYQVESHFPEKRGSKSLSWKYWLPRAIIVGMVGYFIWWFLALPINS